MVVNKDLSLIITSVVRKDGGLKKRKWSRESERIIKEKAIFDAVEKVMMINERVGRRDGEIL